MVALAKDLVLENRIDQLLLLREGFKLSGFEEHMFEDLNTRLCSLVTSKVHLDLVLKFIEQQYEEARIDLAYSCLQFYQKLLCTSFIRPKSYDPEE